MDARCLLVLVVVATSAQSQGIAQPDQPEPAPRYRQAYHFTRDHFTGHIPEWTQLLAPLTARAPRHREGARRPRCGTAAGPFR